jgi:hypothetical protein
MTVQLKYFTDEQKSFLTEKFKIITTNPYTKYYDFKKDVKNLTQTLPDFFIKLCESVVDDKKKNEYAHFIRNCPIDINVEKFDHTNPSTDKYNKKKTFISESFLQAFAELTNIPIFRYNTQQRGFKGSFFYDVYSLMNYKTPNSINFQEVVFHNDETDHKIIPDYTTLLGMRSCKDNLAFTCIIDCREILKHLSPEVQSNLRKTYYNIPGKAGAQPFHSDMLLDKLAILEDEYSFRYCSTRTQCMEDAPVEAKDALIALHDAIIKSPKERFLITEGDLLCFSNRHNFHNRDIVKVDNIQEASHRWLLKTFNFRDLQKAQDCTAFFVDNEPFVVRD